MWNSRTLIVGLAALVLVSLVSYPSLSERQVTATSAVSVTVAATGAFPGQTAVDQAKFGELPDGLPFLEICGFGIQYNPARIAAYALAYAGNKIPGVDVAPDAKKFQDCLEWLAANLRETSTSVWGWEYHFDNTYNDVTIKAPWISAFGQAVGIQALLRGWKEFKEDRYLECARKAASGFFLPIANGGLLFNDKTDGWFEEIPESNGNPPHILNGHMRVLLALNELHTATGDPLYEQWFQHGLKTLENWLPLYDAGYALRYDLNPQKQELLFKIANPYGFSSYPLAINSIALRDPLSKKEIRITLGEEGDFEGKMRIAGIHWSQVEQAGGRKVRRIISVEAGKEQHSYFYLSLPDDWQDNLRRSAFELYITYYDEAPGNLAIQKKSIAPGKEYIALNDGDLLLSGAGQWREWMIPMQPMDLGFWVGHEYAACHSQYLEALAPYSPAIAQWSRIARGYANMQVPGGYEAKVVTPSISQMPPQTLLRKYYGKSEDGVIRQYMSVEGAEKEVMVDSPFAVAKQLMACKAYGEDRDGNPFSPEPAKALDWLLRPDTYEVIDDGVAVHQYTFDNSYNDIDTTAPWGSAFGQAFVLSALKHAAETLPRQEESLALLKKVRAAFELPTLRGGLAFFDRAALPFFEEVPNNTHILIGHLASIIPLFETDQVLQKTDAYSQSVWRGLLNLKRHLHRFDTGYWLKYDQNPPKQLFLQLAWRGSDTSVPLAELRLENPQLQTATRLHVGVPLCETEETSRISGSGWEMTKDVDEVAVRQCNTATTAANYDSPLCYAFLGLPVQHYEDWFDLPAHQLVVRFKDTQAGALSLKIRSINEGNMTRFVPLRDGLILTTGDNQWKTAVISIRPQEMGWFKGIEYQQAEIEALFSIAALANDVFFMQFAERQNYYLEAKLKNQPVVLEKFSPVQPMTSTFSIEGKKVFLRADDDRNPLRHFRIPIPMSIHNLAHNVTKDISSEHEKILRLMEQFKKFRSDHFDSVSLDDMLKKRVGACADFTNLLLAFAASLGLRGRTVNLHNYPPDAGHTVAEIFADGAWRLYDPTYGAYYINKDMSEKGALSYAEIKSGYERSASVEVIAAIPRLGLDKNTGNNIFLNAQPQGLIGVDKPFLFPLRLSHDKSPAQQHDFDLKYQGAQHLGAAYINTNQKWTLENLTSGLEYVFLLTPSGLHDEESLAENVFASFALDVVLEGTTNDRHFTHTFDRGPSDTAIPKELAIRFTAAQPQVKITLSHPYRGPKNRYLSMEQYALTPVQ